MSRNPFRYIITHRRAHAAARLHHRHADARRSASATRGWSSISRARTSTSTTSRSSASCPGNIGGRVSYIGSTMRKLLVHAGLQHRARRATIGARQRRRGSRRARAAAVPDLRHVHGHHREHRRGAVQRAAARAPAPVQGTGSRSTPPTRWPAPTATRPTAATARSASCSTTRTTSRWIAVPIRTSSSTAS